MPNVKIFVDRRLPERAALAALLPPLRDLLCDTLSVPVAACQIALVEVEGLPDQPLINAELQVLPTPERTREMLTGVGGKVRALFAEETDAHIAVRITQLDPETYVALK